MRSYFGAEEALSQQLSSYAKGVKEKIERDIEYIASVDAGSFEKIEYRTDGRPDGADLGPDAKLHIQRGGKLIVHHNHNSLHSLSSVDWMALVNEPNVIENWVHCGDGTRYMGKIIEGKESIVRYFCQKRNGQSRWGARRNYHILNSFSRLSSNREFDGLPMDISPHCVNIFMRDSGLVEYKYSFGVEFEIMVVKAMSIINR